VLYEHQADELRRSMQDSLTITPTAAITKPSAVWPRTMSTT